MSAQATAGPTRKPMSKGMKRGIWIAVVVLAVIGLVLGTRVVPNDQAAEAAKGGFDSATYGPENFPKVAEAVAEKAVDAPTLAKAISADPTAAAKKYAVESSGGPVYSVTFTGKVGKGESGVYEVAAKGVPKGLTVRVQTGPAINGTELRDASGSIKYGQFTNQIEYQDAAAALNNEMKKQVLGKVNANSLSGKTVTVTGAFTLLNPKAWLITPVSLEEK